MLCFQGKPFRIPNQRAPNLLYIHTVYTFISSLGDTNILLLTKTYKNETHTVDGNTPCKISHTDLGSVKPRKWIGGKMVLNMDGQNLSIFWKKNSTKSFLLRKKHVPFHSQKKQSPVSRARYLIKCLYLYKMGQRPLEKKHAIRTPSEMIVPGRHLV